MRISDWSSDVCSSDLHGGSFVSELDAVAGIKTGLACEALHPALYRGVVVGRLRVVERELRRGCGFLAHHLLMIGQSGLAPNIGVGGVALARGSGLGRVAGVAARFVGGCRVRENRLLRRIGRAHV